jgi:hypothetical protein
MKDENLDNLSPALAMRLRALSAPETPDINSMSAEQFDAFWKESGLHISPKNEKAFNTLVENVESRIRLEDARAKLNEPFFSASLLNTAKAAIASLPIAEVRRRLEEYLSMPGIGAAVYARKLEDAPEDDLRSMLLDLERVKGENAERNDNQVSGDGV